MRSVNSQSQLLGLLGSNLAGSPSCKLHNFLLQKDELNWIYLPLQTQDLKTAFKGMKSLPFLGANVTYPYKEKIIPLLDVVDPIAHKVGAVNTIIKRDGLWLGKNSDVDGFINSSTHLEWNNKDILILGAGGAARAVLAGITRFKLGSISVFNRTQSKSLQLAQEYLITPLKSLKQWKHNDHSIIINTTPVGKNSDQTPWKDTRSFKTNQIVIDLIYKQTPLLQKALRDGATTLNGWSMLLHQAAISYGWWTQKSEQTPFFAVQLFKNFNLQQKPS